MAFNWAFSQQFMHTGDTHTSILLIFTMSFIFTPWQIESEKNPTQQIAGLLAGCLGALKGLEAALKVSCAAKAGSSKQNSTWSTCLPSAVGKAE